MSLNLYESAKKELQHLVRNWETVSSSCSQTSGGKLAGERAVARPYYVLAQTSVWEEFAEGVEKDLWLASGKFWQTVRMNQEGKTWLGSGCVQQVRRTADLDLEYCWAAGRALWGTPESDKLSVEVAQLEDSPIALVEVSTIELRLYSLQMMCFCWLHQALGQFAA